ncbi:fimbrial protein [Burkholderia sp. Bp8963]|uniref:fimbrial protein n=1 Tax=Burkholderia sp. Bp8963 TaxID=2184547 RepID=UPI000F5ACBD7|nr:fimbrial protein [Burkholderia sp. Bp8963]RQS72236.1 fimbrial protein [Burkholderia sp. Bp8963]
MTAPDIVTGAPAGYVAGPASLGGFNLLPYRDRVARAMRRRRAAQCGAAILLGVSGVGVWTGGAAWLRMRIDAERARVDARLLRQQPQVDVAVRAARSADAAAQRSGQAATLAAPYRQAVELLALLARVRDDEVRLEALRATASGAELDARAASYRAAARWFARLAHDSQRWRVDVDALKPAPVDPAGAARMPFRFSVQLRWQDVAPRPKPAAVRR